MRHAATTTAAMKMAIFVTVLLDRHLGRSPTDRIARTTSNGVGRHVGLVASGPVNFEARQRRERLYRMVAGLRAYQADSATRGRLWRNVRPFWRGRIPPRDSLHIPTRIPTSAGPVPGLH